MFVGGEADLEGFSVAKKGVVKLFETAALDAEIEIALSGKTANGTVMVAFLVPEAATADQLYFLSDGLPRY